MIRLDDFQILEQVGPIGNQIIRHLARHPNEKFMRISLQRIVGKILNEKFTPQQMNSSLRMLYSLGYVNRDIEGEKGQAWYWYADKSPVKTKLVVTRGQTKQRPPPLDIDKAAKQIRQTIIRDW